MGSTSGTRTLGRSAGSWKRAPILAGGGEMASTSTLATTDFGNVVVGPGSWWQTLLGCCWSVMETFGRISCFTWPLSRCSHLRIWTLPSPSVHAACLVFGCCLWSTAYGFSGTLALLGSTVDTCLREALVNFQYFLRWSGLES